MTGPDGQRAQRLRIFLSSPGDVGPERRRAEQVVQALDAELAAAGGTRLELIRWEESWYSAAGHFQEQLPAPGDCDLVVCLFWKRLGTDLPAAFARADGTPRTGSEWEFEEALAAARRAGGRPDILVYRKTASIAFGEATLELELAQKRALDAFWGRWFRSEEGQFLAAFKEFESGDDFARLLEADLRRWLAGRREAVWSTAQRGSPFPGLSAYDEGRSEVFFGRRRAVEQARARLVAVPAPNQPDGGLPVLLILGMSGAGKSSLLRAGLLPRLRQPGATPGIARWRRLVVTPAGLGAQPLEGLAAALLAQGVLPELAAGDFADPAALAALWTSPNAAAARPLLAALDRWAQRLAAEEGHAAPPATGLLLALDQLEEIFAWPDGQRAAMVRLLRQLAESGRVWILATLRSDVYPLLQADAALLALKEAGRVFDLTPPAAAEINEIVEGPAIAAGLTYERDPESGESLAERLEQDAAGLGALPLLQFALAEIYEGREAGSGLLRWASYRALGGLPGAVEARAETTLRALPADLQAALPNLLFALATVKEGPGGEATITAETLPLEQVPTGSAERGLAEALVQARLLNSEGDGAGARLRVAHEALFTHWGRARDLLAASRADLVLAAALRRQAGTWAAEGRSGDDLLRGARLLQAEDLLRRRGAELGEAAGLRDFVATSAAAARSSERRRRRTLIGAFTVLLLLLAAAVGFAIQAIQQERAAERQRLAAEQSLLVAVNSVETLVSTTSEELSSIVGVTQARVLELLRDAESGLDLLTDGQADSPALIIARAKALLAFADAYLASGDLAASQERATLAEGLVRVLVTVQPQNGEARRILASSLDRKGDALNEQGDLEAAQALYEESLALTRALVADWPDNLIYRRALTVSLERLGDVRSVQGDLETALALYEEGQALSRSLAEAEPDNATARRNLAIGLDRLGDANLARGALAAAETAYREALAIRRALLAQEPRNAVWQRDLTISLEKLSDLALARGDMAAAAEAHTESLALRRGLVAGDPDNGVAQRDLATTLIKQGDLRLLGGDQAGALESYAEAVAIVRALVEKDPGHVGWQNDLASGLNKQGEARLAQRDTAAARDLFAEALAIRRRLVEQAPRNADRQRDLSFSLDLMGDVEMLLNDPAAARAYYEESLALKRALVETAPGNAVWRRDLTGTLDRLGDAALRQDDLEAAEAAFAESLAIMRELAEQEPGNLGWQRDLSISLDRAGNVAQAKGDQAAAAAAFAESVAIRRRLVAADAANLTWRRDLVVALTNLGNALALGGDPQGARPIFAEGVELIRALLETDPDNVLWTLDLVVLLVQSGLVSDTPRPFFEEALALLEALTEKDAVPPAYEGWIPLIRQQLELLPE